MAGPPGLSCSGGGGPSDGADSGPRLADSRGLLPKGGRVLQGQRQRTRGQRSSAPDCAERTGDEGRLGAGHSSTGDRASGGRVESGVNPGPGRAERIAARKTRSGLGPVTDNESLLLGSVARARFARWQELPHLDTTRTQRRKQGMEPPVEAPPTACSARGRGPAEARGFRGGAWRGSRARHGGRSVVFLAGGCGRNSQRPLATGELSRELAEDLQFLGSLVAAEVASLRGIAARVRGRLVVGASVSPSSSESCCCCCCCCCVRRIESPCGRCGSNHPNSGRLCKNERRTGDTMGNSQ